MKYNQAEYQRNRKTHLAATKRYQQNHKEAYNAYCRKKYQKKQINHYILKQFSSFMKLCENPTPKTGVCIYCNKIIPKGKKVCKQCWNQKKEMQ